MFKPKLSYLLILAFVLSSFTITSLRMSSNPPSHETVVFHLLTEPALTAPIADQRNYLLQELNAMRAENDADPLYLDDQLNQISQAHSQDMVDRNYFSHYTPEGKSPSDRAKDAGFTASVGENIAYGPSLSGVHTQLKNSPGHFENSNRKKWTRVGFGIVPVNNNNALYLTVMFSIRDFQKYPLTSAQESSLKNSLINHIVANSPHITAENPKLSTDLSEWLHGDQSTNLFTHMFSKGNYFAMSYKSYQSPYSDGLADDINNSNRFVTTSSSYSKIGFAMKTDASGNVIIYVLYGQ